jgi:putative transposase
MLIRKAFKYKLEPIVEQEIMLNKTAGCCRFVYNYFLKLNIDQYAKDETFVFNHQMVNMLPELKKEYPFLTEVFSQSLQTAVRNLGAAFKKFFNKQSAFPTFKKKGKQESFTCPQKFRIEEERDRIFIPKVGEVKYRNSRPIEGEVKSITISKNCGKWYVSILTEQEIQEQPKTFNNPVGIDVGLKEFAVLSTGEIISNPRFYRTLEEKLAKEQRKLSRKEKYSNNWKKQLAKVQKIHSKIANARKDFLHKLSTQIVNNHDIIGVEDLNIKGMVRNRHLAKSIADAGWNMFNNFLEYKSLWQSKTYQKVERFYPSSQLCSECGSKQIMPLYLRIYVCKDCGTVKDRDYNASKNIELRALQLALS